MGHSGRVGPEAALRTALMRQCLTLALLAISTPYLRAAPSSTPTVVVAEYSGVIHPIAAEFITESIEKAEARGAQVMVLQLDTPGGLDPSMRQIIKAILASPVPVAVYVAPSGARAASAGVFITFAAHFAAMAPATNIGAAHPVAIGSSPSLGKESEKNMESKMANDAAAYLKSLAMQRGRNLSWAEAAVHQSTSTPSVQALSLGLIDWVAKDLEDLLQKLDGRKVPGMPAKTLRTRGAAVIRLEMNTRQRLLSTLIDPNVALLLMSLGAAGIFIELYSPGLILPGVVGVLALILGFYSFQTLSANYAGVLLVLVGLFLFFLEIKVVSYGLLALAGTLSLLLGSILMFHPANAVGLKISSGVLWGTILSLLSFSLLTARIVWRAHRRKPSTGEEALEGERARVRKTLDPAGTVLCQGELWAAESLEGTIPSDSEVTVEKTEGLKLFVRKVKK